ncbi:copper chaperone PCu(A)C [Aestuariivirga sp.]|uniref:copper chaperone PCu(A)C n=1 Tax=Aestuariivirga sp. TaxID=2650926 RepID=UPI0035944DDF
MSRILLELSAAISLTLAAILASATGVSANDLMVTGAFARASATPVAKSGAAYVSVMNHGAEPDRLLSVSTPAARSAELHKTETVDGVMKMEPVGALDVPPNGMIEMSPGGYHIMLMGLSAPLKEGGSLELTFTFEKAGDVKVTVPVGGVAAGTHDHGSGDSGG